MAKKDGGLIPAIGYSLLAHGVLLAAVWLPMFFNGTGAQTLRTTEQAEPVVMAKVVSDVALNAEVARIAEQRAQQQAAHEAQEQEVVRLQEEQAQLQRAAAEAEVVRQREEQALARVREQQIEEAERLAAAQAQREQQEREARERSEAEARERAQAQARAEAQAQARAEAEAEAEAEAKARAEAEAEAKARVEAEAKAQQARVQVLQQEYMGRIREKIARNNTFPGASSGLTGRVQVRLAPGGQVLAVQVIDSSGNQAYDQAMERNVFRSSPLPVPQDPDDFNYFRDIVIRFNNDEMVMLN